MGEEWGSIGDTFGHDAGGSDEIISLIMSGAGPSSPLLEPLQIAEVEKIVAFWAQPPTESREPQPRVEAVFVRGVQYDVNTPRRDDALEAVLVPNDAEDPVPLAAAVEPEAPVYEAPVYEPEPEPDVPVVAVLEFEEPEPEPEPEVVTPPPVLKLVEPIAEPDEEEVAEPEPTPVETAVVDDAAAEEPVRSALADAIGPYIQEWQAENADLDLQRQTWHKA